jgi:hypothetical protein
MRHRRTVIWIIGLSAVAVIGVMMALTASATNPVVQPASSPTPCPADWALSSSTDVRERCSIARFVEKQTEDTVRLHAALTQAVLNPKSIPTIPGIAVTATPGPPLSMTPLPNILKLPPIEFVDGPPHLRHSTSIWQIGQWAGPESYDRNTLYLLARGPKDGDYARLETELDGSLGAAGYWQYHWSWKAPQDVGKLTITDLTDLTVSPSGLTGTVAFTTSSGLSGTLDLATGAWTFN